MGNPNNNLGGAQWKYRDEVSVQVSLKSNRRFKRSCG